MMVVSMENRNSRTDMMLWGIASVLLVVGVVGQYYFASQSLLLRVVGLLVAVGMSLALVMRTAVAKEFIEYARESLVELRKVVWPTRQETVQSTIAVVVMVFIMGVVLWSVDAVLVRVMAWVIRQGAA